MILDICKLVICETNFFILACELFFSFRPSTWLYFDCIKSFFSPKIEQPPETQANPPETQANPPETQVATPEPQVETSELAMCHTNDARAPEFENVKKCRCTKCGLELVVTQYDSFKWRMNSKRAPDSMQTGHCPVCRVTTNTLHRKLGSWPIRSFERLSQEAKHQFMLDCAGSEGKEMIERLVNVLTKFRVEYEHSWAQKDWKPLGVWERAGHDVQKILEGAKDQPERFNNVGERVYMLKTESSRTGKIEQEVRKEVYSLVSKASKKGEKPQDKGISVAELSDAAGIESEGDDNNSRQPRRSKRSRSRSRSRS